MSVRVVADLMAGGGDVAKERGVGGGVFTDHKKRGVRPVRGEQCEDAGRVCGIGAVVDGQPDLASVGGETPVNAKETLRVGEE